MGRTKGTGGSQGGTAAKSERGRKLAGSDLDVGRGGSEADAESGSLIDELLPDVPMAASADAPSEGILTGQLLIAMPAMNTPHFAQAVIYVCAHTPEGAMGIVLNRPLSSPSFGDLLEQLDVSPVPPMRQIDLFRGGPVDAARGFVLHTADWTGDGSLMVDPEIALTASLDVLKSIADGGGPRRGFLALGYAGWGPGQLDREMTENAWLSAPASIDIVFDTEHETKWRRAMAILKVDPILLSGAAGHA